MVLSSKEDKKKDQVVSKSLGSKILLKVIKMNNELNFNRERERTIKSGYERLKELMGCPQNREHAHLLTGGALQNLSIMSPDIELLFA